MMGAAAFAVQADVAVLHCVSKRWLVLVCLNVGFALLLCVASWMG
jgi:hypothetical protein